MGVYGGRSKEYCVIYMFLNGLPDLFAYEQTKTDTKGARFFVLHMETNRACITYHSLRRGYVLHSLFFHSRRSKVDQYNACNNERNAKYRD